MCQKDPYLARDAEVSPCILFDCLGDLELDFSLSVKKLSPSSSLKDLCQMEVDEL